MIVFYVLSHISLYIVLAFCSLCLATGLFYLSELAEEYSTMTKKILKYSLWAVIATHVVLYLFDSFPLLYIAIGIASHLVYMQLLRKFPQVQVLSKELIISVSCVSSLGVLFVVEHVIWYRHFVDYRTPPYDFYQLLGFFFAMVWFCPAGFFVTLTAQDLTLPSDQTTRMMMGGDAQDIDGKHGGSVGFSVHALFNLLKRFLPQRKRQRNSSLDL